MPVIQNDAFLTLWSVCLLATQPHDLGSKYRTTIFMSSFKGTICMEASPELWPITSTYMTFYLKRVIYYSVKEPHQGCTSTHGVNSLQSSSPGNRCILSVYKKLVIIVKSPCKLLSSPLRPMLRKFLLPSSPTIRMDTPTFLFLEYKALACLAGKQITPLTEQMWLPATVQKRCICWGQRFPHPLPVGTGS